MSGAIVLAGGGDTPPEIPQTLLRLAGGAEASVVILAHTQQDVATGGRRSAELFQRHGARQVRAPDTLDPHELAALLESARAVWIPGGDQNRFMERVGNSATLRAAIQGVLRRGGVVGGTSAGASLMGAQMPTGEHSPAGELKVGASPLAPALGLLPHAIVDQHFLKRQRLPRLLCAVLENPSLTGIGIDESGWARVQGGRLTVHRAQVVVVRAKSRSRQHAGLLGNTQLQLQVLLPGDTVRL